MADEYTIGAPTPKRPATRRRTAAKTAVPRIEVAAKPVRSATGTAAAFCGRLPISLCTLVLAIGLLLAGANFFYMAVQAGALRGLEESYNQLLRNYGTKIGKPLVIEVPAEPAPIPEEKPIVLMSVTGTSEVKEMLEGRVASPVVDFYQEYGRPLSVVLIERQKPLSTLARVRLFFKDGGEKEFMWPVGGKSGGWWVPNCVLPDEAKIDDVVCPETFLAQYPEIEKLMK
ncbi:hypothetical protein A3C96_03440 [Candidatus Uhrbacteria bacterium RIFCSPHIGHO2_02_FULL_60_10]|uniref:Uncharacterized protein n=1 Tax=Candidatus Uhrbacteria bacterium RIFCSPHIGHO2_02_FULL_60_10 TaxID=1802392 RepID=A0A1F7U8M1_9BACT|nr:MAG: hypothetical protein A3C96_03440 [Candidatus Uhrbacteria bacterium RIFCSPHIGHO2_02_FULL_60_10]